MGIQINGQNDEIRAVDGSGTVHLDVEGNITGNLTGNADTATTATTADNALGITTSQINVGDTFLKATNQVGLGQTNLTGRNAGVSTATGTVIYNETDEEVQVYKGDTLGWKNIGSSVLRATGGIINQYTDGTGTYRSHTFFTSGTFDIQSGEDGLDFEFLVVAGGGGGGDNALPGNGGRGGGGAGGLRSNMSSVPYALPSTMWRSSGGAASYTVTVGAGGGGNQESNGYSGTDSSIVGNSINIVASGGGGGAHYPNNADPGGSGGGSSYYASPGRDEGSTIASPDGMSPTQQGFRGGRTPTGGAGGGGAGAQGSDVNSTPANGGSDGGA